LLRASFIDRTERTEMILVVNETDAALAAPGAFITLDGRRRERFGKKLTRLAAVSREVGDLREASVHFAP
jgi:hypothetical protein